MTEREYTYILGSGGKVKAKNLQVVVLIEMQLLLYCYVVLQVVEPNKYLQGFKEMELLLYCYVVLSEKK